MLSLSNRSSHGIIPASSPECDRADPRQGVKRPGPIVLPVAGLLRVPDAPRTYTPHVITAVLQVSRPPLTTEDLRERLQRLLEKVALNPGPVGIIDAEARAVQRTLTFNAFHFFSSNRCTRRGAHEEVCSLVRFVSES